MLSGIQRQLPALVIAIPLLTAFATMFADRAGKIVRDIWVVAGFLLTTCAALALAWQVFSSGTIQYVFGAQHPNVTVTPESGGIPFRIIFSVDGLSAFMLVIAAIVSLLVALYSLASDRKHAYHASYFSLLLLLSAGVMGMVATGDLFNLFVFLEIASLSGAALVAYRIDKGLAVEAALKYAMISTVGGLFFLFGIGILYGQYGSLNIALIASRIAYSPLDMTAMVLMAVPMAMKCGAVPMHFWTPDAYSKAPASVTAFLVVSSQASLYVFFRILFTLFHFHRNPAAMGWVVIVLGVLSMFIGVTMALPQKDVKRLMAYHAVSQTGYMLLGVGVGLAVLGNSSALADYGRTAMMGGVFHIINHALYKGLLFLTAGAVIYSCGRRNLNELGGLGHVMPATMVFFLIGAFAIAGMPPLNGFASKFLIYESVFRFHPLLAIIAIVVSMLTLASFMKVFHSMFMGPRQPGFVQAREVPGWMLLSMGVLAVLVVAGGLFPNWVIQKLVEPAVDAMLQPGHYVQAVLGGSVL